MKRKWVRWVAIGAIVLVFGCTGLVGLGILLGPSEQDRELVDFALATERAYDRALAKYERDWVAVGNAFTPRSATVARENYIDGRESETPESILISATYRRAVVSTNSYVEALDAYDAALQAVEDADVWDLLEEVDAESKVVATTPARSQAPRLFADASGGIEQFVGSQSMPVGTYDFKCGFGGNVSIQLGRAPYTVSLREGDQTRRVGDGDSVTVGWCEVYGPK